MACVSSLLGHVDEFGAFWEAAPAADWAPRGAAVAQLIRVGCWAHTDLPNRRAPESMSKQEFGELLLRLCEECFRQTSEARRARLNKVEKLGVWQEFHANGKPHYHFPVLASRPWLVNTLKRALEKESIHVCFRLLGQAIVGGTHSLHPFSSDSFLDLLDPLDLHKQPSSPLAPQPSAILVSFQHPASHEISFPPSSREGSM